MTIKKPLVLGIGGVGSLLAIMLKNLGMSVTGCDRIKPHSLPKGIKFVSGDVRNKDFLEKLLKKHDAAICSLPYHLILPVAKIAAKLGIHYFDPTEDVETTQQILKLAKKSKGVMVPQNGLAPGFINILGSFIAKKFDEGSLRYIKLRVGALPQNPIGQLGYAGNWSLEGLVHEYIAQCDVIADGKREKVAALRHQEILRIEGIEYEAFTTSGGVGTMTQTYEGKLETLNYKSIRYPGHLSGMKMLIEELRFKNHPDELIKYLANALPPDDDDRVLIHSSVQGKIKGKLKTKEIVTDYKPMEIGGKKRTAIAWTTAAAIVAVVEMVSKKKLPQKGFIKQEDISLKDFLKTKTGRLYAKNHEILTNEIE